MDILCAALETAAQAHHGQVDKAGKPYILHPMRVAAMLDSVEDQVVGILHDVLEDCAWITAGDLLDEVGIPQELVYDVVALTKVKGESNADYYGRVKARPRALRVKLADIADNLDRRRLAELAPELRERLRKKYGHAHDLLMRPSNDDGYK